MSAAVTSMATPGVTSPLAQSLALSRRAVLGLFRQPQVWIPSILFPMFFAALNTAALNRTTSLPGFPAADSFLDFLVPATITQAVLFGSLSGASELAQDIENRFFERLVAAPVWRTSILVGRLAGAGVLGVIQAVVILSVFSLFGARVQAGLPGLILIPLVAMLLAVAVGALMSSMALRTGSVEAVQGAFPVVFIFIFASSAFFPRQLMQGWFKTMATLNPVSWMIEGLRHQVLVGFDLGEAATALAVPVVLGAASITLALWSLRQRLAMAS